MSNKFPRRWVCNPLRDVEAINDRLDGTQIFFILLNHTNSLAAVQELDESFIVGDMKDYLSKLPDLERKIAQISQIVNKVFIINSDF